MKKSHFEQMADATRPDCVKKPEPTKRFIINVLFNDNHINVVTDMQNVTDREVEDIIEGIQDQWEFQNKPKPSTKGYRDLDDLADSLGDSIEKLKALIKNSSY